MFFALSIGVQNSFAAQQQDDARPMNRVGNRCGASNECLLENSLSLTQSGFDRFDHFGESGDIVHCHFGECLAIQLDLGFFQTGDEFAIAESQLPGCCIDTDNPECPKFSLAYPTISGSIAICSDDCLLDGSEQFSASSPKALCTFEQTAFRLSSSRST